MAKNYWLMDLSGLFMDVFRATPTPGTPLQIWTRNSPPSANQLWTFEPEPGVASDFFFIKSNLGHNLVVEALGATAKAGMPLIVGTQNSPRSASQLWKWVPFVPIAFVPQGFIQSQMASNLVVDITGGATRTPGTKLEVWTQNPLAQSGNQQWFLLPEPGNTYDSRITSIVQAGEGFTITGAGFQAGTLVFANYSFVISPAIMPGGSENGSFITSTDLGGGFVNTSPITILDRNPGTLQVTIVIPATPPVAVSVNWDGNKFSPV